MRGARASRSWYALEERHAALLIGRVATIVVAAIIALVAPLGMELRETLLALMACVGALGLHLLLQWISERWPERLRLAVDAGLAIDAALILALALLSGGVDSVALWLLPLLTLAATLALSALTGVKAALLGGIVIGALYAIDGEGSKPLAQTLAPPLVAVAAVALAACLATVNERELRRRGERMAALHEASAAFVAADDPAALAAIARDSAARLLPGWRVEVQLGEGALITERVWRAEGQAVLQMPVAARMPGEEHAERSLGVVRAARPLPRMGHTTLRGQQLIALRTLATALAVALTQVDLVQRLERLSMVDALTGLGNRRAFDEALEMELARARRAESPVGLVLIDVDHFKRFNDDHGHQAGDQALVEVARAIETAARREDRACRIGGEEFALLLPGASLHDAADVAERLRAAMEATSLPYGALTSSFGVAASRGEIDGPTLLALADQRLYTAKRRGRNRVIADELDADAEPSRSSAG